MSKINQINKSRKALLATQLEHAVVEEVDGAYKVFVPGAVREFNQVKAKDETEAIKKVKAVLESKIDQLSETETENVEIQPDNLKLKVKGKING